MNSSESWATASESQAIAHALIGPILFVRGGYAFDTWTPSEGLSSCAPYRRIDDARYGRKSIIRRIGTGAVDCATHDEFAAQISDTMRKGRRDFCSLCPDALTPV